MKWNAITGPKLFKPAAASTLMILVGLALWHMPVGERWINVSYDYLFRFGARPVTNKVALILMDNAAYAALKQARGLWDREWHARLLEKLRADGCPLIVFDVFFRQASDSMDDQALAAAMRQHGRVVLMARVLEPEHRLSDPGHLSLEGVQPELPHPLFLNAATNWGIAKASAHFGETPRRHWPFPAPDPTFPSLPWVAARLAGASLPDEPVEQWLRYYGEQGPWASFSYHLALEKPAGYFRDTIVFVGNKPEHADPGLPEQDKFGTPYTRWNDEAVGGAEILATTFLNLMNNEWLRRLRPWTEAGLLLVTAVILGTISGLPRPWTASLLVGGMAAAAPLSAVLVSHYGNIWFPWLVITGGQAPCALALTLVGALLRREPRTELQRTERLDPALAKAASWGHPPVAPDYEFVAPPFGEGGFGKVWLVRNAIGQWQALKAVYEEKFAGNKKPYDLEFSGIKQYKPISAEHRGLLRIDFISQKKPQGYFYYVMELGDARAPGWEADPSSYRPRDLAWVRSQAEKQRLPVRECIDIGLELSDALEFIHARELSHRDIKPSNVIFVGGKPKLADVGLITRVRPAKEITTYAGTADYMPPPPEPPGTKAADIYALGMLLFVISTGREPALFPDLTTTLVMNEKQAEFMFLNPIVLKACHPDPIQRYSSAAEMHAALKAVREALIGRGPA